VVSAALPQVVDRGRSWPDLLKSLGLIQFCKRVQQSELRYCGILPVDNSIVVQHNVVCWLQSCVAGVISAR
jgi:hypothetical protein